MSDNPTIKIFCLVINLRYSGEASVYQSQTLIDLDSTQWNATCRTLNLTRSLKRFSKNLQNEERHSPARLAQLVYSVFWR